MKNKHIVALAITATVVLTALTASIALSARGEVKEKAPVPSGPALTHAQTVWLGALEWCESRGVETAVNPKDRDGTPSFYSFQWKPSTFRYYATKYGVIATSTTATELKKAMGTYATEYAVMTAMVLDTKHIDWHQQFPDCTKRLGYPPSTKSHEQLAKKQSGGI